MKNRHWTEYLRAVFSPPAKPRNNVCEKREQEETITNARHEKTNARGLVITAQGELQEYEGDEERVVIPEGVVKIGVWAFRDNQKIRTVLLPASLREIGSDAFCYSSLEEISIPEGVTLIESGAFQACKKLTTVRLPDSLRAIQPGTFSGCAALEELELPAALQEVKCWGTSPAFSGTGIRRLVIPDGMPFVSGAFSDMNKLESVVLPDSVVIIGERAFRECSNLKEIRFSKNLRVIGEGAFEYCACLEEVILPEGLLEIGRDAFAGCKGLNRVELPDSLLGIGPRSFSKTPFAEANDLDSLMKNINESAVFPIPDGYSTFSFGSLDFYYREKTDHGKDFKEESLRFEKAFTDAISIYKNRQNADVLRIYVSVPTFDSSDREWDSYRKLYITPKAGELRGLLVSGGYHIASVQVYRDLCYANERTKKLMEAAGILCN